MRDSAAWSDLDLSGDPVLVVGRRPRPKQLEAFVVELHEDTFGIMRGIAETTIEIVADRQGLHWHPDAFMEPGEEYLSLEVGGEHSPAAEADLVPLVLAPGQLDSLHPGDLASGSFRFYAVVWETADAGEPVAFVSQYDPTTVLHRASSFFRFDGTLRASSPPDLALDDRADLIVTAGEVVVLNATSFDRLFADVRGLLNDVPAFVSALRTALANLPMTSRASDSLTSVCATRPSYARRLQRLASSGSLANITAASLRQSLSRHQRRPSDFLTKGELDVAPEHVPALLDVAEGRWYEADFTGEPRRAARWSRR